MTASTYTILIFLCSLVIMSYLFNSISIRTRIPSVLMLIAVGMTLRYIGDYLGYEIPKTKGFLSIFGVIGLILIVLEGSLDLKLSRQKLPIIRKSFGSAFLILLITSFFITLVIQLILLSDFKSSLVNAIPLAVISSAIAIPSVSNISKKQKEFITYETVFSDILGIMLFNFVIHNEIINAKSSLLFFLNLILTLVISAFSSLLLLFLIGRLKAQIKSFLIMSMLVLLYSIGKSFHLSPLLLIMTFGLLVNNMDIFIRGRMDNIFKPKELQPEIGNFSLITGESAFLIRTLFFVLFGYLFQFDALMNRNTIMLGSFVVVILFLVRFLYLKFIARTSLMPEVFIAPRGLVTILLFYTIPDEFKIESLDEGPLFFIIIVSNILMMIGLIFAGKKARLEDEYE
jgi:Kef-type K+ transport system membrane component KefB